MNRILHLGLGRFHRGHQAAYYQLSGNWKVTSSTMRSPDERDKLRTVRHRYPLLELSHESENLTWIDCIDEALSLQQDLKRLLEVFCSAETKVVTLTVTEKGYCLNASGELDRNHPGILHDLAHPDQPETAIGFLALAMKSRQAPLAIMSCDNLRGNGDKLEAAVRAFTQNEIPSHITFPNTMVDRIVPSLLPEKIAELESRHHLKNSELIATEKFSQWVIEDHFPGERPDWKGVEFVADVKPYEEMKLRLLNASHSYLAYAGLNRGYQFVHEAIQDVHLLSKIRYMLSTEVIPLLIVPTGFDIEKYVEDILERFKNNQLPHQLKQIAMDGSQKMPQRIFSSIHEARKINRPTEFLWNVVLEWRDFLWNSRNQKIDDPKATELLQGIEEGKEKWSQLLFHRLGL